MPDLPPYVQAADFTPVRAFVRGFQVDAVVLGWRGDRVYLTWKSDRGNHLGWVAATDVERTSTQAAKSRAASTARQALVGAEVVRREPEVPSRIAR